MILTRGKSKQWEENLFHCHSAFSIALLADFMYVQFQYVSSVICGSLMFYVTYAIFNSVRTETSLWFRHKEIHIAEEKTGIIYIYIYI